MAKSNYLSANDLAFVAQLQKYKLNIPSYAGTLEVGAPQMTSQAADADYLGYVVTCQQIMQAGAQQWTAWKNYTRTGGPIPATGAPIPPVFPASVPAVEPGIEGRFRALVKQNKAHPNWNTAIGEALGVEGAEQTGPDLTTIQPDITATIVGNHVEIGWGWQGFSASLDQCEIQVDRGQGRILLAIDTTPGYNDTFPFPATPAKWTYWAIYRVGDQQVGLWSKPVTITVSL
ncbi:MAG: hypothetical protein PCFJNLEI_00930 [Verrucomicrobiae bacterium]|nr:hypothetical protein [Verrucomicrobiae bacterium]